MQLLEPNSNTKLAQAAFAHNITPCRRLQTCCTDDACTQHGARSAAPRSRSAEKSLGVGASSRLPRQPRCRRGCQANHCDHRRVYTRQCEGLWRTLLLLPFPVPDLLVALQRCTTLILRKVAGHYKRTTAVCAYLIELSLTITVPSTSDLARDNGDPRLAQRRKPPNAVMRRLHMVYIVNDVVSTLAAALGSKDVKDAQAIKNSRHAAFVHLKQTMRDLLELVCASAEVDLPTSHYQRIRQITGLWEKAAYFPNLDNLTAYLDKTSAPGQSLDQDAKDDIEYRVGEKYRTQLRSVHFWITRRHGGEVLRGNAESTSERVPWFNLPAANGLYLRRSRGYPLKAYALPVHGFEIEGGGESGTFMSPVISILIIRQVHSRLSNLSKKLRRLSSTWSRP